MKKITKIKKSCSRFAVSYPHLKRDKKIFLVVRSFSELHIIKFTYLKVQSKTLTIPE